MKFDLWTKYALPVLALIASSSGVLLAAMAFVAGTAENASAQDNVLNLYSARHYQTDEALYSNFTKSTGVKINLIEGGEDALMERIKNEGVNSPADVFITVDVGRLWRAEQMGLFAPVKSKTLESRIPANYRDPDGNWFGFSRRARIIVYNKAAIKPGEIATYEDLADPKYKGRICTRSGSHVYNLSLMGSIMGALGEEKSEAWAKGVATNLARPPKGGDTDQITAVASGECGVAIANTYYYARLFGSEKPDDRKLMQNVALVWPNQKSFGTHLNVSGAGVLKYAPNKDAAIRYLEYLASDAAQSYFASGNNEWPAVTSAPLNNPTLEAMGKFKADTLNVSALGKHQATAQKIFDRAGYK